MAGEERSIEQASLEKTKLVVIPVSLALAVCALLLFAGLSEEVLHSGTQSFDEAIRAAIHAHASPGLTSFMRAVTNLGSWNVQLLGTLLAGLFFAWRGMKQYLRLLAVTMAGALVLDVVLKLAVHRARPTPYFIPKPTTYSFPSGHALVSLCFYGLLAGIATLNVKAIFQKIAIWTAAAALIGSIGFSRIYLGVHWPSDVIAGYAAAIVWMRAVRMLVERGNGRRSSAAK